MTKLYCIYQRYPEQIIYEMEGAAAVQEYRCPGMRWPWGEPRGGTVPMPYKGLLLHFFHSGLDYEIAPWRRRYFIGAMLTEANPPFKPLKISNRPVLWGAEGDSLSLTERSGCHHFKAKVVFPLGATDLGGGRFLLSAGINDCHCGLFTVNEKDLHFD